MRRRIEKFFDYKWDTDKNATFFAKEHKDLVIQLNDDTIDLFYRSCLFYQFVEYYGKFFEIPKSPPRKSFTRIQHARYTWGDPEYNVFLRNLLKLLEPIEFAQGEVIREELDEFTEVIFLISGVFEVGYNINQISKYVIKEQQIMIGAYDVTFYKRSLFNYRIIPNKKASGYFIRQGNWHQKLMKNQHCSKYAEFVKEALVKQYEEGIKEKVLLRKVEDIAKFRNRMDFDTIKSIAYIPRDEELFPRKDTIQSMQAYQQPIDIEYVVRERCEMLQLREGEGMLQQMREIPEAKRENLLKLNTLIGYMPPAPISKGLFKLQSMMIKKQSDPPMKDSPPKFISEN